MVASKKDDRLSKLRWTIISIMLKNITIIKVFITIAFCITFVVVKISIIQAAENPTAFTCCDCTTTGNNNHICLQTLFNQGCGVATNALKQKYPEAEFNCSPLDLDKCAKTSNKTSGICINEPTSYKNLTGYAVTLMLDKIAGQKKPDVAATSATDEVTSEGKFEGLKPNLNVNIPGVNFPDKLLESNGKIYAPYLAIYISAIQKYLFGIVLIAAAIMIIIGGMKYMVAGTGAKIESGKQMMIDALIGMSIVMGAYVILLNINPNTTILGAIPVETIKPKPFEFMGLNSTAPGQLGRAGISPRPNLQDMAVPDTEIVPPPPDPSLQFPTYLSIPKDCPGRTIDELTKHTGALSEETIKKFLEYQSKTGIPAGALIANMMSEGAGVCHIQNFWNDPAAACGCKGKKNYCEYYNFGGVGCTVKQMPENLKAANCAFPPAYDTNLKGKVIGTYSCFSDDPKDLAPNKFWNNIPAVGTDCMQVCAIADRDSYNCGMDSGGKCYPQKSYTTINRPEGIIAYPTVQCSRIFKDVEDFLRYTEPFIEYCMPYNTSVYDFAYCIGASTYASEVKKGPILADMIEKNCLCGSRDASDCFRNSEVEEKLIKEKIKINFNTISKPCIDYLDAKQTKCKTYANVLDYDAIVQKIYEKMSGSFVPRILAD
jgi:hypothetical protein